MTSFWFCFISPAILAVATAGEGLWLALPTLVLFGALPALDRLLPENHDNTPGPRWLNVLPFLYVPAHLLALGWAIARVQSGELAAWESVALTVSAGLSTALAINVAHELMHRPGRTEQALSGLLMATASYTHFCVEHVQGHHKQVATPNDPASARLGESLYAYLPRTLVGGLRSAWNIEAARVGFSAKNRVLRLWALQLVVWAVVVGAWGVPGLLAFLGQSAVAVLMLETINYIEHYGLFREETAPGRYERVQPQHSWNASHRASNAVLLNLARHSDHHAFAARSFPELRHHDSAPQLPAGYPAMLILAALPPLWFRVMDPRVAAERQRLAA